MQLTVTKNEYQHGRGPFDVIRLGETVLAERHVSDGAVHCKALMLVNADKLIELGEPVTTFDGLPFLSHARAVELIGGALSYGS